VNIQAQGRILVQCMLEAKYSEGHCDAGRSRVRPETKLRLWWCRKCNWDKCLDCCGFRVSKVESVGNTQTDCKNRGVGTQPPPPWAASENSDSPSGYWFTLISKYWITIQNADVPHVLLNQVALRFFGSRTTLPHLSLELLHGHGSPWHPGR
jgi:hypothetical protein